MLFLKTKNFDHVYAQGPIGSGIPAYLLHNIFGRKYILKIVGDYAWESARNCGATDAGIDDFQMMKMGGKIGILRYLERLVAKNAANVIVPSNYLKKIVLGWGVEENKIQVVYNSFSPSHASAKAEIDPYAIATTGRLVPWKGFTTLIRIMPEILKIDPKFTLHIYGEGPDEKKLFHLIQEMGLKDKIFLSCQTRGNVMISIKSAGMFILNTGYEGLSHTLLECLSQGVPVITTNVGGNPEVIENGKTGFLVEYDNEAQILDAVKKMYERPELRKMFSENARGVLGKFDKKIMMEKTVKIFESI